jgi:PqqD family protein of HPr-rel-A system
MTAIDSAIRHVRRDDVQVRELDGEGFIYDPRTADTHRLNETAWFIWCCCDGGRHAEQILRALTERYDVAPHVAREHVERTLVELQRRNLVDLRGGPAGEDS